MAASAGAAGYLQSGGVPGLSDSSTPPKPSAPKPPAEASMKTEDYMKKKHKFTHTHVEHHKDGTHTVHHVHEEGPHKDVKGAAGDHDEMIDHIMDHTSDANPGEAEAEAGQHGVAAAPAAAAGLPAPAAPAAGV